VDGFFAALRRGVGKGSVNTGGRTGPKRDKLIELVYAWQWRNWNQSVDRFSLACQVFA
jgi:hypothetical protein